MIFQIQDYKETLIMKKIKIASLVLLLCLPSVSIGESSVFALVPRSIGEHHYPYSVAALGRGGFSMAFVDSISLNQMNYALWTQVQRTTFTLNVGYQGLETKSPTNKIGSLDGAFLGGFLAVPIIKKKMSIGFGIQPKSINNQGFVLRDAGIGAKATQTIQSKGTLSEVQFVAAWSPIPDFSLGFSAYYILGKINDNTIINYLDVSYADISVRNEYHFYGKGPSFGVSGFLRLTPRMTIGARVKIPTKMKVFTQQESITAKKTIEKYQEITFPMNLTVGIAWQPFERFVIGGDIDYIDWKTGYLFNGLPLSYMNNTYRVGAGVEFKPTKRRLASYLNRINYRAGLFYGQLNFLANNQPVNEYGLSFGLGLPIARGISRMDVAFQVGKRGDIVTNGLSETFFRLNFSLSASELWFVRDDR
jgi:long-subunit fatty acid transport protein